MEAEEASFGQVRGGPPSVGNVRGWLFRVAWSHLCSALFRWFLHLPGDDCRVSRAQLPPAAIIRPMTADASTPKGVIERLRNAMNQHELKEFLACIDPAYRSDQPVHPNRGFDGRDQVEKNWTAIFEAMADFHAELLGTATDGNALWAEWHWTGTRAGDSPLDVRGVTIFACENGLIVSGRLYMQQVERDGERIDETVQHMAEG